MTRPRKYKIHLREATLPTEVWNIVLIILDKTEVGLEIANGIREQFGWEWEEVKHGR